MSRLFSGRKRFIGLGLMSAFVIALAVLAALWGVSQRASANDGGPVSLVHVNPDGSDYTGNPYCPDTEWVDGEPIVNPWHDCNNITSQNHVIRTAGWDPNFDPTLATWNVENASGATATIIADDRCGDIAEVISRAGWDTCDDAVDDDGDDKVNDGCPQVGSTAESGAECDNAINDDPADDDLVNDGCPAVDDSEDLSDQACLVIHSSTPGETRVTLTYDDGLIGTIYTTDPVVKEWDSLVGSVILKNGDLETVDVGYDADGDTVVESSEQWEMELPLDVNGDGKQDAEDEHELDKQSTWQDHPVFWDEAKKRFRSEVVHIIEVVHGEHQVLINSEYITTHQPTEGAIILAEIESERGCTYFTNGPIDSDGDGDIDIPAGTNDLGTELQGVSDTLGRFEVWVDTTCEEQVEIHFYAQYPNLPGSLREGLHEWIGINWTTIELAKQPQIRWAGEEIVLSKRWALPNQYYPVADADGDGDIDLDDACPLAGSYVKYSKLGGPGGLVEGLPVSGGPGWSYTGPDPDVVWTTIDDRCISRALYSSEDQGPVDVEAALYDSSSQQVINKHAFLVWYLKIYQVKLTNVDGEREGHNAGDWSFGDGEDTVEDTLNVSADALLRVKVKGWFFGGNNSGRGAVCVDIDGDGDGDDATTDDEPGVPYQLPMYETGCPDPDDEIVDHGHWVLPDDLPALAGPDAMTTRPNWDVMSEPDAGSTAAIGPKSTLDSHDPADQPVPWLARVTVVPDGAITEADAIMPPLKIRASIADGDAGFLKEALKAVVYGTTNDYHSTMQPADREIPPFVNNGGYDWDSWDCHDVVDQDRDSDGVPNSADNCPEDANNNQADSETTPDGIGDVCDPDIDGDGDNNDVDPCDYDDTVTVAAPGTDTDGDTTPDSCDINPAQAAQDDEDADQDGVKDSTDNCPTAANTDQADADSDGEGDVCDLDPDNAPVHVCLWEGLDLGPYEFWAIFNKFAAPNPNYIEFYTDNRGEGMFFANGDFNLDYTLGCRIDPVTGDPDCSSGDVVGESNITVIGDYPYFRKHSAVQSNPVVKTWEWGGDKKVTAERIDATHTAIVAYLTDRDGFCKYEVKDDPTAANGVQFSPSLNPVQLEEIEFILNTGVGSIIEASPNALYNPEPPHTPLGKGRVTGLEDAPFISAGKDNAIALADDGRVLDYYGEARCLEEEDECQTLVAEEACQAWIVIEHPMGAELDVSVRFNDPEGVIYRDWPPSELTIGLVQGWNDVCYVDEDATVEDAMADIIDDVMAVYRFNADQTWDRHFPGRCDEEGLCTLDDVNTLEPYDQLFILMSASADWTQVITALPVSVSLVGASAEDEVAGAWNSVCYAGVDKATDEATSNISSAFVIMYSLGADQMWRRYVPDRPEIPDTLTTLHTFDSVILLVTAEGGTTWVFDP